jgi:hypothetical protein
MRNTQERGRENHASPIGGELAQALPINYAVGPRTAS